MNFKNNVTNQAVKGVRQLKLCLERPGGRWIEGDGQVTTLGKFKREGRYLYKCEDHGKQVSPHWAGTITQLLRPHKLSLTAAVKEVKPQITVSDHKTTRYGQGQRPKFLNGWVLWLQGGFITLHNPVTLVTVETQVSQVTPNCPALSVCPQTWTICQVVQLSP